MTTQAFAKLLVSEPEAAKMLDVSQRTLFTLRKASQIPFVKLEGRILYSPVALQAWIDQKIARQPTATETDPDTQPAE